MIDIVERLAGPFMAEPAALRVMDEAASEIERLRAALELFACDCGRNNENPCHKPENCRNYIARVALEGK